MLSEILLSQVVSNFSKVFSVFRKFCRVISAIAEWRVVTFPRTDLRRPSPMAVPVSDDRPLTAGSARTTRRHSPPRRLTIAGCLGIPAQLLGVRHSRLVQGRRPHWSFRGLLNVHWLLRPVGSPSRQSDPSVSKAPTVSLPPRVASIATGWSDPVAGWELHPLKIEHLYMAHTESGTAKPPKKQSLAPRSRPGTAKPPRSRSCHHQNRNKNSAHLLDRWRNCQK